MSPFLPIGKKTLQNEARPRERSNRGRHTGVRTGSHYLISLPVCQCVRVTLVVFTDCESCTRPRPIFTNSGSMEAGEYGLTRGTCFVACRFEFVVVAGRL